jgi:hypothetical protein
MDCFVKPIDQYQRDVDFIGNYVTDMATYLSKMTGQPRERCLAFIQEQTKRGGSIPIHDPDAGVLVRQKNGDRKQVITTLQTFLEDVRAGEEILSPSMTSYLNPRQIESLLGQYIGNNLVRRSNAKKQKFSAVMDGNETLAAVYDGLQTSLKIKINSLSGAHVSEHTILFNKSAHSTLTSTCRSASGYGNTNNEKFLMGNRHYWSPDVVVANVISIINHTDLAALDALIVRRSLVYPSIEQIMDLIKYSTDWYWSNPEATVKIRALIERLDPVERAAFAYVGDMYHLAKFNPEFVREFLGRLSHRATEPCDNPDEVLASADADLKVFVSLLCAKQLAGKTIKDTKARSAHDYGIIAATTRNAVATIGEYTDVIRCLWVTNNMPSGVAHTPTIIRRAVITSDTDSTIFTVQHWTHWYTGDYCFTETSNAICATVVYLASQTIRHVLAQLSANMGVIREHLTVLQMKNEFVFPVFALTSRAKHYYTYEYACEGNVYEKLNPHIKGVALRSSAVPPDIMAKAKAMMLDILDTVMRGEKISYVKYLKYVGDVEREIYQSILEGSYRYFSTTTIKSSESYKLPLSSNYMHYELWESVFAPKYGHTVAPPYTAVKVSIDADTPTKLKAWLDRMEDPAIANNLRAWLENRQRKDITTLLLPHTVLTASGIPKEIVVGINQQDLVGNLCESFYLILESIGLFLRNREKTRTASNTFW